MGVITGKEMEKFSKSVFEKWECWCQKIDEDLTMLLTFKQMHNEFSEIVNANLDHILKNDGGHFCKFIDTCYAYQALVGIRRHARKGQRKAISLMKLLNELANYAENITYQHYLEFYPPDKCNKNASDSWQRATFSNLCEENVTSINSESKVSKTFIDTDIKEIEKHTKLICEVVDKGIAHMEKNWISKSIIYADIVNSLELLNKMTCKYMRFIMGHGPDTLTPIENRNWKQIFKVPLNINENSIQINP